MPGVSAITAPSLIIVGSLMMGSVRHIDWDAFDEAFPAFLVILSMPLTSSIATGIALGFISYPLMKVAKGKFRAVHPLVYVFGILFAYQLIFLPLKVEHRNPMLYFSFITIIQTITVLQNMKELITF